MKLLDIHKTISYCERCPFCTWKSPEYGSCGWYCVHSTINSRLILCKEDYDCGTSKHVHIPEWCPLSDLKTTKEN